MPASLPGRKGLTPALGFQPRFLENNGVKLNGDAGLASCAAKEPPALGKLCGACVTRRCTGLAGRKAALLGGKVPTSTRLDCVCGSRSDVSMWVRGRRGHALSNSRASGFEEDAVSEGTHAPEGMTERCVR